jgi:hypothetical protein
LSNIDCYELIGLNGSSPIGFLATLGMLRVLSEDRGLEVKIGWKKGHAVIEGIDPKGAIEHLFANMAGRAKAPEFTWSDSPRKIDPEFYRCKCLEMSGDSRALGFMAGWATDAVLRDGFISVTRMDMTSGRQQLLKDLRSLASRITEDHLQVALMGGGYEEQSSFGLDPVAVRSHAHEHRAPTETTPPGKPGLVWLAFESIPFHPVYPTATNRTQTTGWRGLDKTGYVWPLWDTMLTLEEVRLLRSLPIEHLFTRPGVIEVWASRYGQSGKYGMFLPAQRER